MALLVSVVLALVLCAPAYAGQASEDPDAFTPVEQSVLAKPWPVKGSDGRYHVVYEVQLVNASSIPWEVTRIAVRDAGARNTKLASWTGARVADVTLALAEGKPTRRLEPGQAVLLHLAFSKRKPSDFPKRVVHELRLTNAAPSDGGPPKLVQRSGRTSVIRAKPSALGPPLEGSRWLAADGCCTARRHVWATQPFGGGLFTAQRFAIDWERLDSSGRLFVGDEKRLENWAGYGADILAVADATVVRAIDGLPQQVPGALPVGISLTEADGNAVFLKLRDGRYVFYAHMIPGSLTVKAGDRVRRGQVLGKLGNSGNSSAPHLHLHMMDRNAMFAANGIPYVFRSFDITGKVASTEAFDKAEATGEPVQLGPVRKGPRRNELSLDQVIVTWP